jgi:hypothetical protein
MDHTPAYSLVLFNAVPKRSGLVKHPDVPMHSLSTEPHQSHGDWWLRLVRAGLASRLASSLPSGGGSLTDVLLDLVEKAPGADKSAVGTMNRPLRLTD